MLLVTLLAFSVGCGDSGPPRYAISGTVTLDDDPIESGQIIIVPTDMGYDADVAVVVNGKFTAEATAGSKKVTVTATRVPAGMDPMKTTYREEYIPTPYQSERTTDLVMVVSEDGPNEFELELVSERARRPARNPVDTTYFPGIIDEGK